MYKYGQQLKNKRTGIVAFVVTKEPENEYLIKMSNSFPMKDNTDYFFVHVYLLNIHWTTQTTLFETLSNSLLKMRKKLSNF